MLVTITRQAAAKKQAAAAPIKFEKYKPYEPYKPYVRYAKAGYQKYQGYKPYGHPDHPFKPKPIEDFDKEMTLRELLHKNRLALPPFSFVKVTADKVIVEIEPSDVQSLLDVVAVKNLEYSLDENELPISCQFCGENYEAEHAKKGLCPHCYSITCKDCGESFSTKHTRKCPHCKVLPGIS